MAFLDLASFSSSPTFRKAITASEHTRLFGQQPRHHIFLSYRHADRKHVPQVAEFIKQLGTGIYIDYLDDELIQAPSSQTAPILRSRISQSKKLIQLLTPNSGDSKWMPWELGLGDGLLGYANSVILPAINGYQTVTDQDYLSMYGYVEKGLSANRTFSDWLIRYPNNNSIWFSTWLSS